ncbi:MAG: hypothetical protein ACD_11C00050G0001 [uncultured bacterium]|nr:MAG: hypothetical protein ACD_11C00050G0001 [uncultured bacterium]
MKSCDTQRLRFLCHGFEIFFSRVAPDKSCARVGIISLLKKNRNWCRELVDFDVSNKIQSGE